ncbi:MAG: FdrA family protein, partial [Atribacterota bacterium]|nr:FdrA family protein [Atribacterota bacterium]
AISKLNNIISKSIIELKSGENIHYYSLDVALKELSDVNLAFISTPGQFAANEAKKAIEQGVTPFIFSDNVPLSEEVELKKLAKKKNIFVMGPGCGTSVINGISLGLMSSVRQGSIGIVGASGSGIHEIAVLIDRAGLGISQAIGTGGRDLLDEVGGMTMIQGLKFLKEDPTTKVIVLISKPPSLNTMKKVLHEVSHCIKPVVVNFIGGDENIVKEASAIPASTLEDTALRAISIVNNEKLPKNIVSSCKEKINLIAKEEKSKNNKQREKYLRGLFFGGTHCEESILILQDLLPELYSNIKFQKAVQIKDANKSYKHTLIDLGGEEFTKGKPHPVIDPSIIKERLWSEGSDVNVAVILLDILLGYGAHIDPVGVIEDTLKSLKDIADKDGRHLSVVVSVCGTDKDPQNLHVQIEKLKKIGCIIMPSNAQAAFLSGLIVS